MAQRSERRRHPSDRIRALLPASAGGGLAGLFMLAFLACGLLLALTNPSLLRSPDEPLLDGSWARSYERRFDESSALRQPSLALWGAGLYLLFREGHEGVLIGEDDWLFTSEEFELSEGFDAHLRANLDAVASVRGQLEERGVELVVALVPAKARVHAEALGRYRLPPQADERYRRSLAGLQERGVVAVDLLAPLQAAAPSFLRTDTHWSPSGAGVAARAVAEAVAARAPFSSLGETRFETRRLGSSAHRGDLLQFLHLGPLEGIIGPQPDSLPELETVSLAPPSDDLFAPVELPVALVGTSYSADGRWNFRGALAQALGAEVLGVAQRGQGPFAPMAEYLAGEELENAQPELVVWEIPERYLTVAWPAADELRREPGGGER